MNAGPHPLTCKLTTPELQKRRATVIQNIKDLAVDRKKIHEGVRFKFDSTDAMLDTLLDFVKTERLCCDFFDFRLSVSKDVATLEITGPEGAGEFLNDELGL